MSRAALTQRAMEVVYSVESAYYALAAARQLDRAAVLGQTITGTIDIADDRVRTEVALTWLMGHLVKPAEALIKREGELMLQSP